jgi:Tol biopolymer transport system component
MVGEHKPFLFLQTHSNGISARFSPDGHWVVYSLHESESIGLYVQSFPTPGEIYQVSKDRAYAVRWRADGKEIFFIQGNSLMAADVIRADKTFASGIPRRLFLATFQASTAYDVSRDGQKFLINATPSSSGPPVIPITVVLNWPTLLKK